MEKEVEALETHTAPEGETPEVKGSIEPEVDIKDLKHRADVSSQNFERAKKAEQEAKELRERLALLEEVPSEPYQYDDEKVSALQRTVNELTGKVEKSEILEKYPQLKDVWDDFESFYSSPENQGMPRTTAAKAFIIEKDLIGEPRKGLEKPVGGGKRVAPSTGMTKEEAEKIRTTDARKYRDMLKKGLIQMKG